MKTTHNLQSEIYPLTKQPRVQLENQVFGQLTAKKPIGRIFIKHNTKMSRVVWECSCTCGNTHLATATQLIKKKCLRCLECTKKANKVKGTANLLKYINSKENLGTTEYSFRRLVSAYKSGAVSRNLNFNLTDDQVRELTSQDCHYCGQKPDKEFCRYRHKKSDGKPYYRYNGIDRKNSSLGYNIDNCVPCCSSCNFFKGGRPYEDFISLIKTIYNHVLKT